MQAEPMEAIVEIMRKRLILVHEGWGFVVDTIGGVKYYRAVSPDGWLSVIDLKGLSEDWAIEKAWEKRIGSAVAQFEVAEWLRKHGENAGLTWDKTDECFCATKFVKKHPPQEAFGTSPAEAVLNWKEAFEKKP